MAKVRTKKADVIDMDEWLEAMGEDAMLLTDKPRMVDAVSCGNLLIDLATGIGGFPMGRIVEIFGKESSGKSTLAQQLVVECQKRGMMALYVDAEHSFDPHYFKKLGGTTKMALSQPQSGDRAFTVIRTGLKTGKFNALIVDSVAALVPKEEFEADDNKEAAGMSLQARMMSAGMRRIVGPIRTHNVLAIFINQIREKPGVSFGSPEYTPGGNALKFYTTMRVKLQNVGQIKDGEDVIGNTIRVRFIKNKLAAPFKKVDVPLIHGKGFDVGEALFDICVTNPDLGFVTKSGKTWHVFGEKYVGRAAAKDAFMADTLSRVDVETAVLKAMKDGTLVLPEKE